jgi:anti-sigma B factor antagonist
MRPDPGTVRLEEAGMTAGSELDTISSFFRLSVDHRTAAVVVGGELDRRHTHLLLDGLRTLVMTPLPVWTIDLTDVTFCDTTGLGALVEGHELAREHQRALSVVGASECVHRQLTMAGLEPLLCPSLLPPEGSGLPRRPLPWHPFVSRTLAAARSEAVRPG